MLTPEDRLLICKY